MRFLAHYTIITLLVLLFISCSEDTVKLYHDRENVEHYWLLEKVQYSNTEYGLNKAFSYTNDDVKRIIDIKNSDLITIDYLEGNVISYSKIRNLGSINIYDSLLVKINGDNRAAFAYHVTYNENIANEVKAQTQKDSTAFTYNSAGYLVQLDRYNNTDPSSDPTYWEKYTIENNNLTLIETSSNYIFNYSYDNQPYNNITAFCYEMPFNTKSLSQGGCWLLTNLSFLSEYLGKKSNNNIESIIVTQHSAAGGNNQITNISYNYTFDENRNLIGATMSGTINTEQIPENSVISFSYLEKEKK